MKPPPPQLPVHTTSDAPLPAERAFVVQLRAQGDSSGHLFVGRVEHIATGAEARFSSAEDLIAFITDVLAPAATRGAGRLTRGGQGELEGS